MGAGSILQISASETAKVYGYDDCPDGEIPEWPFGPQDGGGGCIKLTGNDTVAVMLIKNGERIDKIWKVSHNQGPSSKGVSLARPNGWVLREQES